MSGKLLRRRISKADHFRALLTDVLPYELPIGFGNAGLYGRARAGRNDFARLFQLLGQQATERSWTRPLEFCVSKSGSDVRVLSVVHPIVQIKVAELYGLYREQIVSLCSASTVSLRRPEAVASFWHERRHVKRAKSPVGGQFGPIERSREDALLHSGSYFAYGPYTQFTKFEGGREFALLERRFRYLLKLDISHCFPSIYTHSIEWAVKGKEYAKEALGGRDYTSLERGFDQIMRAARDGQTSGIPVGPEFSRVFAEIIFQRLDSEVCEALRFKNICASLELRRWVDDYFIFADSQEVLDEAHGIIAQILAPYNLRFGPHKTQRLSRPFHSQKAMARRQVHSAVRQFARNVRLFISGLRALGRGGLEAELLRIPAGMLQRVRSEVHQVMMHCESSYHEIATSALLALREELLRSAAIPSLAKEHHGHLHQYSERALRELFDIALFFAVCGENVRGSFLLTEIVYELLRISKGMPRGIRLGLENHVYHEIRSILLRMAGDGRSSIQGVQLLTSLTLLGVEHRLSEVDVTLLLSKLDEHESDSYFWIVGLVHHLGDASEYQRSREALVLRAQNLVARRGKKWMNSTEPLLLVLDLLASPYLSSAQKREIAKTALRSAKPDATIKGETVSEFLSCSTEAGAWFFDWYSADDVAALLRKKDLHVAY